MTRFERQDAPGRALRFTPFGRRVGRGGAGRQRGASRHRVRASRRGDITHERHRRRYPGQGDRSPGYRRGCRSGPRTEIKIDGLLFDAKAEIPDSTRYYICFFPDSDSEERAGETLESEHVGYLSNYASFGSLVYCLVPNLFAKVAETEALGDLMRKVLNNTPVIMLASASPEDLDRQEGSLKSIVERAGGVVVETCQDPHLASLLLASHFRSAVVPRAGRGWGPRAPSSSASRSRLGPAPGGLGGATTRGSRRVIVTRQLPGERWLDILSRADCEVEVCRRDRVLTGHELTTAIGSRCDGCVGQLTEQWGEPLFAALEAVGARVFSTYAVGYDNVDLESATRHGIAVGNTPEVLSPERRRNWPSLTFAAARRIAEGDRYMREGRFRGWRPDLLLGELLWRKTVGVVGAGRVGAGYACMMVEGHKMDLLYYDLARNEALESTLHRL